MEELEAEIRNEIDRYEHYNEDDLLPPLEIPEREVQSVGQLPLIVLIDDNPELRSFLKNRLQAVYEVLEAANGQEGLQLVFEYLPELVICDVMMPVKDGTSFLKIVKSDVRTAHIPVILLTARTSKEQQVEGLRNQADAFVVKPFDLDILESTMQSLLENRNKLRQHVQTSLPVDLRAPVSKKNDLRFLSDFKSLVNQNISNDQFSVEEICRSLGVSKVQLYRKVKALLNSNVNEYILSVRLQRAKYLLQHEDLSVAEIAYQTGFASPAYFSTVFKNHEGISPSAYKGK